MVRWFSNLVACILQWVGACSVFTKLKHMGTRSEINRKILLITNQIHEKFPELTKYLDETQEHFHCLNHKDIKNKDLTDYLESLLDLLDTYSKNILEP